MKTMNRALKFAVVAGLLAIMAGCSSFTSVERRDDGKFVMTGWEAPGPKGFLWIGEYDESSRTMKIVEKIH